MADCKMRQCEKRVTVITGGTRGFGAELVKTFSKAGGCVAFTGRSASNASSEKIVSQPVDAGNVHEMSRFLEEVVNKWHNIDTLIINAGMNTDNLFLKTTLDEIDALCHTNLKGFYAAAHAILPHMMRQKAGHIIAISSFSATVGRAGQALYCAVKAALAGAVKSLAREVGKDGIQANMVLPGFLPIGMGAATAPEVQEKARCENVLGHLASSQESADFIAYLAEMKSVSGQIFNLDSRIPAWI